MSWIDKMRKPAVVIFAVGIICLIAFYIMSVLLPGIPEPCPDCDTKYDIVKDEYIYVDGVFADSDGQRHVWWSSRVPDCTVQSVCVCTDAGPVWVEAIDYGSWESPDSAYHAVFCARCEIEDE